MRKLGVKKILLIGSMLFFILIVSDAYLLGLTKEEKSLENYKTVLLPQRSTYNRVCEVTLKDNTCIRIQESKVGFLGLSNSCDIYSTFLFNKVVMVSLKEGDTIHNIKTGFLNNSGGDFILIFSSFFFVLGSLLLFTKLFDRLEASEFGPYVVMFFQLGCCFFYATTP
jgi:hypothetical protein